MRIKTWLTTLLASFVLNLSLCSVAAAQEASEQASAADKAKQKLEKILKDTAPGKGDKDTKATGEVADPARPKPLPAGATDPETKRLFEKALQDYYSYRSRGLAHRTKVFEWQLFSAKTIFVIVLALVIIGIVFAGIQFRHGMKAAVGGKGGDMPTEIELGSAGVKISSPVLGVIILFLSLGFFYLYLVYVYPIENIF